jgi:hypothetical protein
MKTTRLVVLIVVIALALFLILPNLSWAGIDDGGNCNAITAVCSGNSAGK